MALVGRTGRRWPARRCSTRRRAAEALALALRTPAGVPLDALPEDPDLEGLVDRAGGRAVLTVRGRLLANAVTGASSSRLTGRPAGPPGHPVRFPPMPEPDAPDDASAEGTDLLDKVIGLCKRRGIVFQSAEIYGGFRSTYDYGPLGVNLLRNVKNLWWEAMVQRRDDVVGLDAAILGPPAVWAASATWPPSPTRWSTARSATSAGARTRSTGCARPAARPSSPRPGPST